ncbi:peptidase S08 family protein [Gordonia effusa NBRC 100432]|uniref:Peptidase S08 family protein n=1 Tax=Gordonia effusa NBRC 100432 TaxID=1077974 RepID=H0R6M3_9ACTN|nr:type VII secretion-associated serine protease mycosin [Gordonia effusa]GAB20724.1 peptidase S08 family protein [Gordonia effusa NBRC 100432]
MLRPNIIRIVTAGTAALVIAASTCPSAAALTPPSITGPLPSLGIPPGPAEATEQRSLCATPTTLGRLAEPPAAFLLNLSGAWQFSRGRGQTVAVIDTGVTPHPRLPRLRGGGDYVARGDGLSDCDAHGTVVAGIIAATTSSTDSYGGVAPEATILSIRQSSGAFAVRGTKRDEPTLGGGVGTVRTLAAAVVRAVELGVTVINISEVACTQNPRALNDASLGAAIKFAYDRDVVVVVAAGNLSSNGACREQNPAPAPGREWDSVTTVASPAWFAPYVLTVGAVDSITGAPSSFSLHGPWVSVAAPGTDIIGLTNRRGGPSLINGIQSTDGPTPINGTSFAAPYVAGTAALIRARFPHLRAAQVMARIIRTAHSARNGGDHQIGAGVIDPVAALTHELDDDTIAPPTRRPIAAPPSPATPDPWPRRAALIGTGTALGVVLALLAVALPYRRVRRLRQGEF